MSFKKSFLQNVLVSGGYNYATQAIVFFSTVLTSRLLAPESFGFVALIAVFTGFISIFLDSGITFAVIRTDYKTTFHKALNNLALLIGVILCGITWLLAYPISLLFHKPELFFPTLVMGLLFVVKSLTLVRGAVLSKDLQFAAVGKVTLLTAVMQVLLTVVMAYFGAGYWSLIVPQIAASLVMVILYESTVGLGFKLYPFVYCKAAYKSTKKIIGNLMGFNFIYYWARNLDNLLVGKYYGITELGIYNRAYNLLMMPMGIITGLVANVLLPSFKKLKAEGGDVNKEYLFILKMIAVATFPVSAVLIVFPEPLVLLLWGKNWLEVSHFLPYFGLLLFSQSLLSTTGNILVLFEKERIMVISGYAGTAITTAGILYGASISMVGIAQFYSLSFIAIVLPFNLFYLFIKTFRFNKRYMLLFWLPIIAASLAVWLSCYFGNEGAKLASVLALFLLIAMHTRGEFLKAIQTLTQKRKPVLVPIAAK